MPPTGVIDAEKLYEKEIARLQGEVGNLTDEQQKLQHRNALLSEENSKLESRIQENRDKIVAFNEKLKAEEEAFKNSRANSIAALEKRDSESVERMTKAESSEKSAALSIQQANQARNQLISIAEDIGKTVQKIKTGADNLSKSVEVELQGYLALREPSIEIPVKDVKK